MQTWTQRGLQAALVTGGLLVLGTGIASATENVNPDQAPGPVDASVSVPVHIQDNVLATPMGELRSPTVDQNLQLPPAPVRGPKHALGNQAAGQLSVPVQLCGNAAGVAKHALVTGSCAQRSGARHDLTADAGAPLTGNVARTDMTVPVQVTGNAFGALGGSARSDYRATQTTDASGDVTTTGAPAPLSGNVLAASPSVPVGVNGVAGGALFGDATTRSTTTDDTRTGGRVSAAPATHGTQFGTRSHDEAGSATVTDGRAGQLRSTPLPNAAALCGVTGNYVHTVSTPCAGAGFGSANVAAVPVAVPAQVSGLGGSGFGAADATATTTSTTTAGGADVAGGAGGFGSGNVLSTPVGGPAQMFGSALGGFGTAHGYATNTTTQTAGGGVAADGANGALAGNVVHTPVNPLGQMFGMGGAAGATGSASGVNDTQSTVGGPVAASGGHGQLAGNAVAVPVQGLAGGFGTGTGAAGSAGGSGVNAVDAASGGPVATSGAGGTFAGNGVAVPVQGAGRMFGDTFGAFGATPVASGVDGSQATTGGAVTASGAGGNGSGNALGVPVQGAMQTFGSGAGALSGNGFASGRDSAILRDGGSAPRQAVPDARFANGVGRLPLGFDMQVFRAELPVFSPLLTTGTGASQVTNEGEQTPVVDVPPGARSLPGIGELPSLPIGLPLPQLGMPSLPGQRIEAPHGALGGPAVRSVTPSTTGFATPAAAAAHAATVRSAPVDPAAQHFSAAAAPAPGPGLPTDNLGIATAIVSDVAVPVLDTTGTVRGLIPIGPDGIAMPDLGKMLSGDELNKVDIGGKVKEIVAGVEHAVGRVNELPLPGAGGSGSGLPLPLPGVGGSGSGLPLPIPGVGGSGSGLPLPIPGVGGSGSGLPLPIPGVGGSGSGLPLPGLGGSGLPLPGAGGSGSGLPLPGLGGSGLPLPGTGGSGSGLPLPGLGGSGLPLPGAGGSGSGLPLPGLGGSGLPLPGAGGSGSGLPLPGLGGSGLPLPGVGGSGSGLPLPGLGGSGLPLPGLGKAGTAGGPALANLDTAGNGMPGLGQVGH